MARVVILDVPGDQSDPDDSTGLTEEAHMELSEALMGWDIIDVKAE